MDEPQVGPVDLQGAPERATNPGKLLLRIAGGILLAVAVMVVASLLLFAAGGARGIFRLVIAGAMGLSIAWFGVGYFRQLGNPPPPDPEPTEVHPSLRLAYVCEMCGLELAVVKVAKDKAPRHCGEGMVLVQR
ncbi:MAG: hypothetical protein ABR507_04070 [Actinomycetota bacterium]|nr:hypothetical protein [Actinomycetota bacterium]